MEFLFKSIIEIMIHDKKLRKVSLGALDDLMLLCYDLVAGYPRNTLKFSFKEFH